MWILSVIPVWFAWLKMCQYTRIIYYLYNLNLVADYVVSCGTISFSQLSRIHKLALILFTNTSRNHITKLQKIGISLHNYKFKLFTNLYFLTLPCKKLKFNRTLTLLTLPIIFGHHFRNLCVLYMYGTFLKVVCVINIKLAFTG